MGEDFAPYLRDYHHNTMILNVKSERIEHRAFWRRSVRRGRCDYFFLDCSFPIQQLVRLGEHRIAVRFSEFEPIERAGPGQRGRLGVDRLFYEVAPGRSCVYARLEGRFQDLHRLAGLQGHDPAKIGEFARQLAPYEIAAVCKHPALWTEVMGPSSPCERQPASQNG